MNSRELRRLWRKEARKILRAEKKYTTKFYSALKADTDGFLAAFEGGQQSAQAYINSLLISERIGTVLNDLYRNEGAKAARESYNEQIKLKAFETLLDWFNEIMNYIGVEFYNKGLLRITETTRNLLQNVLNQSIQEGWGYAETAKYFREVMPEINRNRAITIARTESAKAIHAGKYVGAKQSPYEQNKVWLSGQDARTRRNPKNDPRKADHFKLNGQTVDFDSKFHDTTNDVFMLHPSDPTAPASEVIRCRCSYVVLAKRDANGRLIRKS